MLRQIGKGRAGRHLPDGVSVGRIVDMPANLALQLGFRRQARGIAAVGAGEETFAHKYTCKVSCKR